MKAGTGFAVFLAALVLDGVAGGARADVVYLFRALTATIGGAPTDMTATGSITLTDDAGPGTARIASAPLGPSLSYTFDGIAAASFRVFSGPDYAASPGNVDHVLFNLVVAAHGDYLDFAGGNQRFGGFAVDPADSDAYYAIGNGDLWTIGYGSDNPASPCFGSQVPGSGSNRCVVKGTFQAVVPEPATLPMLAVGLLLTGVVRTRLRSGGRARGTGAPTQPS